MELDKTIENTSQFLMCLLNTKIAQELVEVFNNEDMSDEVKAYVLNDLRQKINSELDAKEKEIDS